MKIKLIFDSENEKDMMNYGGMMKHKNMYLCLAEIREELRQKSKYGHSYKDAFDAIEGIYESILNSISSHGLNDVV